MCDVTTKEEEGIGKLYLLLTLEVLPISSQFLLFPYYYTDTYTVLRFCTCFSSDLRIHSCLLLNSYFSEPTVQNEIDEWIQKFQRSPRSRFIIKFAIKGLIKKSKGRLPL